MCVSVLNSFFTRFPFPSFLQDIPSIPMELFPPTLIVPSFVDFEPFTPYIPTAPLFSPFIPDFSTFTVPPLFIFASP